MATKTKALTAAQRKERDTLAFGFAVAIAGSTIIFEVLDKILKCSTRRMASSPVR
jgi:hypothetical protein